MAFDIRTIFGRSLGGRTARIGGTPGYDVEALGDDETPESPITAATRSVEFPNVDELAHGGATAATLLMPQGMAGAPSASVDRTHGNLDGMIDEAQARRLGEVAVMAATIYGRPSMQERQDLLESLRSIPGLESLSRDEMESWIDEMIEDGGDSDPDAYVASMEERIEELASDLADPELRRAAYQLAVYFAAWQDGLGEHEEELLDSLCDAFEIEPEECDRLRGLTLAEIEDRGAPAG